MGVTGGSLYSVEHQWFYPLNANYPDDMREIEAAVSEFPARVDRTGTRWARCDLNLLQCIIRKIVAARMPARVPMLFLAAGMRRSMRAFACTRLVPRDMLREINSHMWTDESVELNSLFNRYIDMRYITGLRIRAIDESRRGPWMRVNALLSFIDTYGVMHIDHVLWPVNYTFHDRCHWSPVPHFYMKICELYIHSADTRGLWSHVIEFAADEVIEFAYKRLDKRSAPTQI